MYSEAVDDEKLRLLAFEDRWHFVAILCLKCQGSIDSDAPHLDRRVALKLGLQLPQLDEVKRRLIDVGLITDEWQPVRWSDRQFESDISAERTKAWRERTSRRRPCDVTVTAQDTEQNRTEQNKTPAPAGLDGDAWKAWLDYRKASRKPLKQASIPAAQRKLAAFGSEQSVVVEHSIANGYQGLYPPPPKPNAPRGTQPTDSDALRKLADRRAAIGLPDFRDPRQGESADDYRNAQDAEYKRLQTSRAAPKFAAELAQQKRIA